VRDAVQEILHGITGQRLILDPPEGRPSSITSVSVFERGDDDDANVRPATTGSAAVDTNPNTTTATSAAGASQTDPRAITVTSATGIVLGRPLLLSNASQDSEWVEFVALNGTAGQLRQPLIDDYPIGSTLVTTRVTIALDSTWIVDRQNLSSETSTEPRYRVAWTYVVGGVTYRRQTQFDVVRYTSTHNVMPTDVDNRFPGWLDRLPVDYRREQGRSIIDQAWREVRVDMRGDNKLGRWLRNLDVVSSLVIHMANFMAAQIAMQYGGNADQLKTAGDAYKRRYDQLVAEPHTDIAVTPMGGQREADRAPLFRR